MNNINVQENNLSELKSSDLEPLQHILMLLKKQTRYDFSFYKLNTIAQRIFSRIKKLQIETLSYYIYYLHHHPEELEILNKHLLMYITHFFRDPEAFDLLKHQLLTKHLKRYTVNDVFRVWVPGCATGEEAYSIAIILQECMSILNLQFEVKIFATDINADLIDIARLGIFSASIENRMSRARLQTFFIKKDGFYKVDSRIRKMIVFAVQNVIYDPPIHKVHLISCRNLLIYFNSFLQSIILRSFYVNLNNDGLLLLGSSEGFDSSLEDFNLLNTKWRLYECKIQEPHMPFLLDNQLSITSEPLMTDIPEDTLLTLELQREFQSQIQALEISNEELRSLNEEAQATNEELQSLNEELIIINTELENKIEYLSSTKEELQHLLEKTEIATICLDKNLCIKRYTPKALDLINLLPADIGRPIYHLALNLKDHDLLCDIQTALSTLESIETDGVDRNGRHYLIKIIPYSTENNILGGVVITFLNVHSREKKRELDSRTGDGI